MGAFALEEVPAAYVVIKKIILLLTGGAALALFSEMALFGVLAYKLKQYPPMGLNYLTSFRQSKKYEGARAAVLGSILIVIGMLLSLLVAVTLIEALLLA